MGSTPEYFQTKFSQVAIAVKGEIDKNCSAAPKNTVKVDFSCETLISENYYFY
jgi:hypothetical protein